MTFLYFFTATQIFKILSAALKGGLALLGIWLVLKLVRRLIIRCFYSKINRVVICGKKNLVHKRSVPTGYSEGYYRTEHYKYVYTHEGTKYKTKVYFGSKFFIPYAFRATDNLFLKLLNDADISLTDIKL